MKTNPEDLKIRRLGECAFDTPLKAFLESKGPASIFVKDEDRFLFDPSREEIRASLDRRADLCCVEKAGPRAKIFFDPKKTRAAIVTCGGLCPGINDVIRGVVMELYYRYGVTDIAGIPFGYRGFVKKYGYEPVKLTPASVKEIHRLGGSMLGTSRGHQNAGEIIDYLRQKDIRLLFVIGGDGTLRGAILISEEAGRQSFDLSVIGIPKTVDNDILYIDRSFGFETAFSEAARSVTSTHSEAMSAVNGVGLLKLMGRYSGFIACFATLAMGDVNFVLIPEVPFRLDGENGFLSALETRIRARGHAVVVVAEGAGQDLMGGSPDEGTDASGNPRFKDIGLFLKDRINAHFASIKTEINVKYIDPSYDIRAILASPMDSVYCLRLAQHAVHAAMSGRTEMVVAMRNGRYVHLPMKLLATGRKRVDPEGDLWVSVLSATGQPAVFS